MSRTDGKPAGWRWYSDLFWARGEQRKCRECLKVSEAGARPETAHERKCSAFPAGSIVRGPDLPAPPVSVEREHPIDAVLRRVDKPRPRHRDRGFLSFVRDHACCSCEAPRPSDPHHWSATVRRGVGMKLDDLLTVPLCRRCHDCYHATTALPGRSRAETEMHLLGVQVELLVNWIAERKLADALDSAGEEPI